MIRILFERQEKSERLINRQKLEVTCWRSGAIAEAEELVEEMVFSVKESETAWIGNQIDVRQMRRRWFASDHICTSHRCGRQGEREKRNQSGRACLEHRGSLEKSLNFREREGEREKIFAISFLW